MAGSSGTSHKILESKRASIPALRRIHRLCCVVRIQPLLDIALALFRDALIGRDLVTVGGAWVHVQFAGHVGVIQRERMVDVLVEEPVYGTY